LLRCDGQKIAEGKAFNKKDASQIAAQLAVEKLGIINADSIAEEQGEEKKQS
jgi:ribonuclease-3